MTYAPGKTVLRGGFGVFVGPGQGEDLIQPIESDRVSTTLSTGPLLAFPINHGRAGRQLHQQPEQPQLPAARLRAGVRHSGEGLPVHRVGAAGAGRRLRRDGGLRRQPGPQPVPAQRRQPDRRASSPTRTRRARRSSSASSRSCSATRTATSPACRTPTPRSTSRPAAATTSYNAMMLSLNRRSAQRPGDERAVHARPAAAARRAARTRRTRPPTTPARSTSSSTTNGYNNFDVRHTFNLSLLYSLPYGRGRTVRQRRQRADAGAARRLGRRRHRQRAQRPAGAGADRPARHRLSRRGGQHLRQPGGGPRGGHQHAGRRRVAQRAAARPGPRRRSVHQGRRPAVPEPGGVRDAGAGHVRQPRAQLDPRPELQAGRLLLREALRRSAAAATSSSAARCSTCSTR